MERKSFEAQGNLFIDIDRSTDIEFDLMSDGRLYVTSNDGAPYNRQHVFIELNPDEVDALRRLLNSTKGN